MNTSRLRIKDLINDGLRIINQMKIMSNSPAGPNTRYLKEIVKELFPLISDEYPQISGILSNAESRLIENKIINAFCFGDIRTSLKILKCIYERKRKVFISHSSKDKVIVQSFTDHILRLGIGLDPSDIFCSSIEELGIRNGEDIRKHIKENLMSADFSFLLISENYKKSEICLNEMGAVWANNSNVRCYLLQNTGFDKIGWLYETKQAEVLCDQITLDRLYEELTNYYGFEIKLDRWSRQRAYFTQKYIYEYIE